VLPAASSAAADKRLTIDRQSEVKLVASSGEEALYSTMALVVLRNYNAKPTGKNLRSTSNMRPLSRLDLTSTPETTADQCKKCLLHNTKLNMCTLPKMFWQRSISSATNEAYTRA